MSEQASHEPDRLRQSREQYTAQPLSDPPGHVPPVLRGEWRKHARELLTRRPGATHDEVYRYVMGRIDAREGQPQAKGGLYQ